MSEHKHLTFFSSLTNFIPFGAQSKNFPYLPLKLLFTMFHVKHTPKLFPPTPHHHFHQCHHKYPAPPLTQPHPLFHVKQSFFSQAFWPIPQLTPADISSTINISPQCFTWNTHPKRIPISSFCNQRPTTRSISPLNHVRETILFHVEHCWDQCYLQRYISRKTYKQARRLNAIFTLKSTCYVIF